jgi:hypothetical protein
VIECGRGGIARELGSFIGWETEAAAGGNMWFRRHRYVMSHLFPVDHCNIKS